MLEAVSSLPWRTHLALIVHWVDGPEDQGESSDGAEEGGSAGIFAQNNTTSVEAELVYDDQVGNAGNGVPSPFWPIFNSEGGEQTGQNHDDIGNKSYEDASTIETSQETQVEQEKWGGDTPVDVTGPVDLTLDDGGGVGEMLLGMLDLDLIVADTITNRHGKVGDGSKSSDESGQDVEHAFLLEGGQLADRDSVIRAWIRLGTYNWHTECHGIEGN